MNLIKDEEETLFDVCASSPPFIFYTFLSSLRNGRGPHSTAQTYREFHQESLVARVSLGSFSHQKRRCCCWCSSIQKEYTASIYIIQIPFYRIYRYIDTVHLERETRACNICKSATARPVQHTVEAQHLLCIACRRSILANFFYYLPRHRVNIHTSSVVPPLFEHAAISHSS